LDDPETLPIDFAAKGFYLFKEGWRGGLCPDVHLDAAVLVYPYQALFLRSRRGFKIEKIEQSEVEFEGGRQVTTWI
jgi:hypothetical protein